MAFNRVPSPMVVTLGQQCYVGRNPPHAVQLHLNRHAETPNKTKTKDTMSLDYSSVCNIGSRTVWVSMKEIYHVVGVERCIPTSSIDGVESK